MTTLHLDIGHAGKPGRNDPGAVFGDLTEVDCVRRYVIAAESRAFERAVPLVDPTLPAWYPARQREASELARAVPGDQHHYIACHMNGGTAHHGIIGHDVRSKSGKALAERLAASLRIAAPWLSEVQVHAVGPSSTGWQRNVWSTIRYIYDGPANICGVCYEPGFLGHPEAVTEAALRAYGYVLADVAAGVDVVAGGDTPPPEE